MNSKLLLGIVAVIVLIGGAAFIISGRASKMNLPGLIPSGQKSETGFPTPIKSLHYENNVPEHGSVLAGVPLNVVIDFNFDLAPISTISITQDGKEYGIENTVVDENKLALRRKMDPQSPDGRYTVAYKACWPDQSCHNGMFEFAIDRSKSADFTDMTGRSEVTISMENIAFNPRNIRISKGTKVTWVNNETDGHYVNTDPHAGHSYYPAQNSRLLNKGDSFSLVFDTPGIYPYHCSAHASLMTGTILVE